MSEICGRDTPWVSGWLRDLIDEIGLIVAPLPMPFAMLGLWSIEMNTGLFGLRHLSVMPDAPGDIGAWVRVPSSFFLLIWPFFLIDIYQLVAPLVTRHPQHLVRLPHQSVPGA